MDKINGIVYLVGDATQPIGEGKKIIAHVCNDCRPGRWGSGFVLAISKRWKDPETEYRRWSRPDSVDFQLGNVQFVDVGDNICVANMVAQRDIYTNNGVPPIRYDALDGCLTKVSDRALSENASVHMPRIGCCRAGGKWEVVDEIVKRTLSKMGVKVFVYDLPV